MRTQLNGLLMGLVVACLAVASMARGSVLEGRTVATTDFHGTAPDMTFVIGPVNSVVGPGVELTNFGWSGFVDIDFSDTNILITATIDQPFGYFEVLRFADADGTIPDFASVTINPATDWAGFDSSRIYLNNDFGIIDVNVTALQGLEGQQISLDLTPVKPGDLDGDGVVGTTDLLALLAAWGPCPGACPPSCPGDLDGDCMVSVTDLLGLLADWS